MRKVLLGVLVIFAFASNSIAGNWSIHCTNNSCVAEQGALKVYWMATSMFDAGMYRGKLTGVEGIPVAIDDYRTVEKRIQAVIEKASTRKRGADAGVKAGAPEVAGGGPAAGATSQRENLFTQKRTIGQDKVMGERININYTLVFVEWLGDTWYGHIQGIRKYWAAAEHALQAYKDGTIAELIERFLIQRNAAEIDNVAVDAEINDENQNLILTKYIGLTIYPAIEDAKRRYSLASDYVYSLSSARMQSEAEKISEEFRNDLKALALLMQPNQTARNLYRKNKDLAFAKWLADNDKFTSAIDNMETTDKYLAAVSVIRRLQDGQIPSDGVAFFTAERKNFETAITNREKSVEIITFAGSPTPEIPTPEIPIAIIIAGAAVLLIGGVVLVRRRKKNNQGGVSNEV